MRWTQLNFKKNTVYLDTGKYELEAYPANQKQHQIFKKEFIERGKNSCTFKEFRERCVQLNELDELTDFDHRGHRNVNYGAVKLDMYDFLYLKQFMVDKENNTFEQAFSFFKESYRDMKKKIEKLEKNKTEDEKIITMVKSIKEVLFSNN